MTLHYHCEPAVCVYVVCVCDRVVSCCVGPQWFLDGTWRSAARDAEIYLLLYNQVKYHSGGGPDTVEPRGVRETVCLRLRPCPPVCVCLIHNVAETGPCFMTLLLWGHIASLPSSFTTPSNSPPPPRLSFPVCPLSYVLWAVCIPSFPVADCQGGSGCQAGLKLTSGDSSNLTGRRSLDQTWSHSPPPDPPHTPLRSLTHMQTNT